MMVGVADAEWVLYWPTERYRAHLPKFCMPVKTTAFQQVAMIQLYANAHPETLLGFAGGMIYDAMSWGFPCPGAPRS
jgi:hypothetical protein